MVRLQIRFRGGFVPDKGISTPSPHSRYSRAFGAVCLVREGNPIPQEATLQIFLGDALRSTRGHQSPRLKILESFLGSVLDEWR